MTGITHTRAFRNGTIETAPAWWWGLPHTHTENIEENVRARRARLLTPPGATRPPCTMHESRDPKYLAISHIEHDKSIKEKPRAGGRRGFPPPLKKMHKRQGVGSCTALHSFSYSPFLLLIPPSSALASAVGAASRVACSPARERSHTSAFVRVLEHRCSRWATKVRRAVEGGSYLGRSVGRCSPLP